jgi:hypothetical protein
MTTGSHARACLSLLVLVAATVGCARSRPPDQGVFLRIKLLEPAATTYFIRLGGHIHEPPWFLSPQTWPPGADNDPAHRLAAGQFTEWFDIGRWAGEKLHGRMNRAGGIAEFPNVTIDIVTSPSSVSHRVAMELATAPTDTSVVRRFEETFEGPRTSVLVSPRIARDAGELETLWQMAQRHLRWAREATGGKREGPRRLLLQTSVFGNATPPDVEAIWLLGFNVVGSLSEARRAKYPELREPGHSHDIEVGPAITRPAIDATMKRLAMTNQHLQAGVPFGFSDEVVARPGIGTSEVARAEFRAWLAARQVAPQELGVQSVDDVIPIDDPPQLHERAKINAAAARRIFYYSSRYRQLAASQRLRWSSEALHASFPPGVISTSLVADHPYFSGTGLGMGMSLQNTAWGGWPLALDWFDLARTRAVDMIGIEDWMGLQYMYGPEFTWEGPQLMGFQAAIFRSGSRGTLPIMAWITPSDETGFLLKMSSALAQGAKHTFFWTYGPTAQSTENYWSDLRGAYDGVARYARQIAAAEAIIAPGTTRPTRVALLYSISADLWQPFGYIHMLERRATYLALTHEQYLVDMLSEEDIAAGRLKDYDVLYVTDPNIATHAGEAIARWVGDGGALYGACGAGSRNEFDEPARHLAPAFGIEPAIRATTQPGKYHVRAALNRLPYMDEAAMSAKIVPNTAVRFGVLGARIGFTPATGRVVGRFKSGQPAAVENAFGKGRALYIAACPGLSYLKDAGFVPTALEERYPAPQRHLMSAVARAGGATRLVELSEAVVEAGVFDAPHGTALVLANFTHRPIDALTVRVPVAREVRRVRSMQAGDVRFALEDAPPALRAQGYGKLAVFAVPLGINDIVLLE